MPDHPQIAVVPASRPPHLPVGTAEPSRSPARCAAATPIDPTARDVICADTRAALIPDWIIADERLSAEAVRLYGLLSLAADDGRQWRPLARRTIDGARTLEELLHELLLVGALRSRPDGPLVLTTEPPNRGARCTDIA